jgi:beta-lactam-binding protein with PASTA domain
MNTSGLRASLSASNPIPRMVWLVCLAACFLLSGDPVVADTSGPSTTRGVYVPPPSVQVPELRQRVLSEAQKVATDAHLRLQVSGEAPADPSKVVVVEQKPAPNTMVAAGTTITVVVQVPIVRRRVPERLTTVPDLLKRPLSDAQPLVTSVRLKLEVSGGSPEDTSHAIVVDQKPPAGTRVPVDTTVTVTVQIQRPEDWTQVPDLMKQRLSEALRPVRSARLRLEVSGGWPEDPSRASIVDQKPSPGTRVRPGSTVFVTVQIQGTEELAVVPELRPQVLPDAQRRIKAAGLRLEVAGGWPADPTRAIVVEQKPGQGTRVPFNTIVVATVRILRTPQGDPPPGPQAPPIEPPQIAPSPPAPPLDEWVLVPGLLQRPLMEALKRVRSERLRLEVTGGWPSDPAHAVVVDQTPVQGTRVRIGTSISVHVLPAGQAFQPTPAAPPPQPQPLPQPPPQAPPQSPTPAPKASPPRVEMVVVPELRQQLLPDARQLTTSARLELRVRGQSPADETRTIVMTQSPAAGARVAARSIVLVELGAALIAVPDLRKHPLDEARQILSQAGFELSIMGDPPSNESQAQVVEQAPLPGVRAAAGSTVTVRAKVSRLTTWVIAGAGALLAAGAALGVARWRGVRSHPSTGLPAVRVVANGDVGKQEIHSNGAAAEGFAIRLRSRIDPGAQTVEANGRIVAEERRVDG